MSSTDGAGEAVLHRFFVEKLTPVAQALRRRGVTFFATGPDASAASYYVEHRPAASPFAELEADRMGALLRDLWARDGCPELVDLAGELAKLAPELAPREEQSGDVSPFVYVMF